MRRQKTPKPASMLTPDNAVTENGHFFSAAHLPRSTRDSIKLEEGNGIITMNPRKTSFSVCFRCLSNFTNRLILVCVPVSFCAVRFYLQSQTAVFGLSYRCGVFSALFPNIYGSRFNVSPSTFLTQQTHLKLCQQFRVSMSTEPANSCLWPPIVDLLQKRKDRVAGKHRWGRTKNKGDKQMPEDPSTNVHSWTGT